MAQPNTLNSITIEKGLISTRMQFKPKLDLKVRLTKKVKDKILKIKNHHNRNIKNYKTPEPKYVNIVQRYYKDKPTLHDMSCKRAIISMKGSTKFRGFRSLETSVRLNSPRVNNKSIQHQVNTAVIFYLIISITMILIL